MAAPHRFDPTILREYDIRGIVDKTLTEETAYHVGRSLGTMIRAGGGESACVGYDGRLSSPALETATVRGLRACGLRVYRIGMGPTPMLYFAVHHLAAGGGVMITGSHNPPDYNGFKMMIGTAAVFGPQIQEMGRIAAAGTFADGAGGEEEVAIFPTYIDALVSAYTMPSGLKVAWDCGNGAAGPALRGLVDRLPGEHVVLYDEIDGNFPNHHPDPTVEANLADLKSAVVGQGCDLGIAFDGDGDRIGTVDCDGRVLWGDQLLVVLADEVLRARPGATIIADVKASQVLFDEISRMGGTPIMWKTGHSLVKAKMKELGAPLAGEMSGHIFFADRYFGFDDALYVAVRLLNGLVSSGRSLKQWRDGLPTTEATPELRISCPDEVKFAKIESLQDLLRRDGLDFSDVDGVRVSTTDGWWLLRASNTQPVLVARAEAGSVDGLVRLKRSLQSYLDRLDVPFVF